MAVTVSELFVYPIKSCAGINLSEAVVQDRGFKLDRRWMIVDSGGVFISQRDFPAMCLLTISLREEEMVIRNDRQLFAPLSIPLTQPENDPIDVLVWRSSCKAIPVSDKADDWFSKALGISCRLVYMPESTKRLVNPEFAKNEEIVSFADGYPFLVIGQASINDLNVKLTRPVSVLQFRPNIVFTGSPAYTEDNWEGIRIGETVFFRTKNCTRCNVISINPQTAEQDKEPLATLSKYRKEGNNIIFGAYLISSGKGLIKVGDQIESL
ncbi:MAG: hypothetical protein ACI959_000740 [Limisphaerales bacterium]